MTIADLPAINASLNAVSTVFISLGWFFIRRGFWQRHVACMITALLASSLFLIGYIIYHVNVGEKSSGYTGLTAWFYFPMLISHILLAVGTLPLVIMTVIPALRQRFDRHKKLARWTFPVWLYVSVTGVLVYFFCYVWYP